jgi:hypothetical protein
MFRAWGRVFFADYAAVHKQTAGKCFMVLGVRSAMTALRMGCGVSHYFAVITTDFFFIS